MIPDDPKVFANLLILAYDPEDGCDADEEGVYREAAVKKLTDNNVQNVAEGMLMIAGSRKKLCHKKNIMRFLMDFYQKLSPETVRELGGLLQPYISECVDMANESGAVELTVLLRCQQEHLESEEPDALNEFTIDPL